MELSFSDDGNAMGFRGMRPLDDVSDRCNLALNDQTIVEKRDAMQVEMCMLGRTKLGN